MPMSFILRAPPLLSFVFIRMRVIADKPTILPTEANFSKKEFVFSKDKNLPINRMSKAKKQVLYDRLGCNNSFVIGGLCVAFRF